MWIKRYAMLVFFILMLILPIDVFAATTINAASCSYSDVSSAISSASAGDTVTIPACSETAWTTTLTIDKPILVIGAGQGVTNIVDDTDAAYDKPMIDFTYSSSSDTNFRLSGMTIRHSGRDTGSEVGVGIGMSGTGTHRGRIDHITMTGCPIRCLGVDTGSRGVIDNSSFDGEIFFASVWGEWDNEWLKTTSFGSEDAWYVEDSDFDISTDVDGVTDCQFGGRLVFRHNTVTVPSGSSFSGFLVGNHGYDSVDRGCMLMEVYENTFTHNSEESLSGAIQFRGGTGYVYNNTILGSGSWNGYLPITNYRSCTGYLGDSKGMCDGSHAEDGNIDHGWPCRDQIGRGGNQADVPLYEYNNCRGGACGSGGTKVHFVTYDGSTGDCSYMDTYHIKSERDYYNDTQRPSYTPYTYPHPLRGEGESPAPSGNTQLSTSGKPAKFSSSAPTVKLY